MANQENNPFILPGFGQPGALGQNPVLASMEMMRKAWENLATGSGVESAMMQSLNPEDLERRISDLRAVENWLRMNLAMLSSTIQGLEVQRATVSTLRSFVASAGTSGAATAGQASGQPSPLDVVLGLRPHTGTATPEATAPARAQAPQPSPPAEADPPAAGADSGTTDNAFSGAAAAAQGWWDMLQKQFDTLAAATSAGMQSAEAMKQAAAPAEAPPSGTPGSKAAAPKAAARKTAARKTAARKSAPASRRNS